MYILKQQPLNKISKQGFDSCLFLFNRMSVLLDKYTLKFILK